MTTRRGSAAIDVGAVAGEDVVEVFSVSEREDGEVEQRVASGRLGPVENASDLVAVDEDVVDLQIAVYEHRCPRPQRSHRELTVPRDDRCGNDIVGDQPVAFDVEARCELVDAPTRTTAAVVRRATS